MEKDTFNQSSVILSTLAGSGHGWWEPEPDVLCLPPRTGPWHGLSRFSLTSSPWARGWAHVRAGVRAGVHMHVCACTGPPQKSHRVFVPRQIHCPAGSWVPGLHQAGKAQPWGT